MRSAKLFISIFPLLLLLSTVNASSRRISGNVRPASGRGDFRGSLLTQSPGNGMKEKHQSVEIKPYDRNPAYEEINSVFYDSPFSNLGLNDADFFSYDDEPEPPSEQALMENTDTLSQHVGRFPEVLMEKFLKRSHSDDFHGNDVNYSSEPTSSKSSLLKHILPLLLRKLGIPEEVITELLRNREAMKSILLEMIKEDNVEFVLTLMENLGLRNIKKFTERLALIDPEVITGLLESVPLNPIMEVLENMGISADKMKSVLLGTEVALSNHGKTMTDEGKLIFLPLFDVGAVGNAQIIGLSLLIFLVLSSYYAVTQLGTIIPIPGIDLDWQYPHLARNPVDVTRRPEPDHQRGHPKRRPRPKKPHSYKRPPHPKEPPRSFERPKPPGKPPRYSKTKERPPLPPPPSKTKKQPPLRPRPPHRPHHSSSQKPYRRPRPAMEAAMHRTMKKKQKPSGSYQRHQRKGAHKGPFRQRPRYPFHRRSDSLDDIVYSDPETLQETDFPYYFYDMDDSETDSVYTFYPTTLSYEDHHSREEKNQNLVTANNILTTEDAKIRQEDIITGSELKDSIVGNYQVSDSYRIEKEEPGTYVTEILYPDDIVKVHSSVPSERPSSKYASAFSKRGANARL